MKENIFWVIAGLVSAGLLTTQCRLGEASRTVALYQQYCGSCHLTPDPADLSKSLWTEKVLPDMGARLGIRVGDYDPMYQQDMQEALYIKQSGVYPAKPLIGQQEWDRIYQYILSMAPDSLPVDADRADRSRPLVQFKPRPISIDNQPGARTTAIYCDSLENKWWIGNRQGEWYELAGQDSSRRLVHLFGSAISGFTHLNDSKWVTEMGFMDPSDNPRGKLWLFSQDRARIIAENLHRPVFVQGFDLEEDGQAELLVCEFGNLRGRLSLLNRSGDTYQKRELLSLPGTICTRLADMNQDGRTDLVVLAGQGDEGIYILYHQGEGKFSYEHPVRLPPVYGSSWFELFDYDGDGDLDIALVNGDNADFTYALKPYHGFRLFLNKGGDEFEESFFYPLYGATRLVARDFDRDGDFDFGITALFPDYEHTPQESFVYLENRNSGNFEFQSFTSPATLDGNWLVMEAGDMDNDGDDDILLGSYVGSPAPVPYSLLRRWLNQNVDLLWLENTMTGSKEPR